jgi:hypothetical protein
MNKSYYDIQKAFMRGVLLRDIAEPLPSFDAQTPAIVARALLDATGGTVAGVRTDGFVSAHATREALVGGSCGDCAEPIDAGRILPDTAVMATIIHALNREPYFFVRMLGTVVGLVTRADLEDPPVRMWLFGLLSTIEARFVVLIQRRYGEADGDLSGHTPAAENPWAAALSPARMEKARALQQERQRRQLNDELLHCLQFADKAQIVARDKRLRAAIGFVSRKRADQTIKEMERLRNNLAHGQEIVASDWDAIVTLAENLARVAPIANEMGLPTWESALQGPAR